ncbi:hypothetical protein ACFXAZ_11935 [Streptomyces sp. NPDC059477]|uniref:hypothetical protein n=1 Tax=Streptomyces sp. NPDC059477 TaxID=3346847 RepID=UPI0036834627
MDFDPSKVTTFELRNEYALMRVRVRLEDADDYDDEFHTDESRVYDVRYEDKDNTHILTGGKVIQQLDLNDGSSADDLNMPRTGSKFNENNSIQYVGASGVKDEVYQLADFTSGDLITGVDHDGINDDHTNAVFTPTVSEDATRLIITISRG